MLGMVVAARKTGLSISESSKDSQALSLVSRVHTMKVFLPTELMFAGLCFVVDVFSPFFFTLNML